MKIKADTALLQARLHILRAKAEPKRMQDELDAALAMLELVWPKVHDTGAAERPAWEAEMSTATENGE